MAAQQPVGTSWSTSIAVAAVALREVPLPEGWSIVDYPGKQGKANYAVFAHGRRLVSGMTSSVSAERWARLMAATAVWRNA